MKRTMMIIIVMAALAAMAQEERRVFPLELSPLGVGILFYAGWERLDDSADCTQRNRLLADILKYKDMFSDIL